MLFISEDLIRIFDLKSSEGDSYILSVMGMLPGYTFCTPVKPKLASYISRTYTEHFNLNLADQSDCYQIIELSSRIKHFPPWWKKKG